MIWFNSLQILFESMPETRNGYLHRFPNLVQFLIQFVSNMICFDTRVSTQILRIVLFQIHKVHKIDSLQFLRIVLFQIQTVHKIDLLWVNARNHLIIIFFPVMTYFHVETGSWDEKIFFTFIWSAKCNLTIFFATQNPVIL